ncbi:unnamed protein product [Fusarium graminearum]|nr:unnamed protein product [Fusarium graminearum]
MRFSSLLTSGLASFSLVAGHPTVTPPTKHSVQQVRNPVYKRDGIAALLKVHRKYHIDLPDYLATSALARRDGTGAVTNRPIDDDAEWLTPVQIGNPPRTFQMDLDTGSSDLWVHRSQSAAAGGSRTRYNSTASKSCEEISDAKWLIQYGDGSGASGHVVKDTVSIGGFQSINTVTLKKQKTFFKNAKDNHGAAVFTADLQHDAPGTYTFGIVNKTAYTGDIVYTDVDPSNGMWTFKSVGFTVGDGKLNKRSISAIADTGTSLIWLPGDINKAYYSQVKGAKVDKTAGGYVFPCDTKLPDFTLNISGLNIGVIVPGAYMNFSPLEGPKPVGIGSKAKRGDKRSESGNCFGGLQSSSDSGLNIIGGVALKAAFMVFDADKRRIGFAKKILYGDK